MLEGSGETEAKENNSWLAFFQDSCNLKLKSKHLI